MHFSYPNLFLEDICFCFISSLYIYNGYAAMNMYHLEPLVCHIIIPENSCSNDWIDVLDLEIWSNLVQLGVHCFILQA